jgi:hypothetical protein
MSRPIRRSEPPAVTASGFRSRARRPVVTRGFDQPAHLPGACPGHHLTLTRRGVQRGNLVLSPRLLAFRITSTPRTLPAPVAPAFRQNTSFCSTPRRG